MERIEVLVHAATDLNTPIETIGFRWSPTVLEEHNRPGGGSFRVLAGDDLLTDERNPLQTGRVVREKIGDRTVGLWEILKHNEVIVDEGEESVRFLEISGPSVRDWLGHGVVYPQAGIASVSEDRNFNYSAAQGSWYKPAEWKAATVLGAVNTATTPWGVGKPAGWPKALTANWLWDRPNQTNQPAGDVYFRKTFSTTSEQTFRIVATADDYASVLIDGERVLAITEFKAQDRTFTADVTLPSGNHVMAVKARNGLLPGGTGRGPGGLLLAMCRITDESQTEDLTNTSRQLFTDATWVVQGYPVRPPGFTVGNILIDLISEAKARGVDRMQPFTMSFTADLDSYGRPWPSTIDPSFKIGANLTEVIKQITDTYADVWVTPDLVVHAAPERGLDRSTGLDPVVFRKGQNVVQASTERVAEISNTLMMKTATGYIERSGPQDSIQRYGRRETYMSAVNASENGTAPFLVQQLFNKFAAERATPTLRIYPGDENLPWRDFFVGDWILAPNDAGTGLIKRRVVSISADEDENGEAQYVCEIDTIMETLEERLVRWLEEAGNDSKSGGVSGTRSGEVSASDIMPAGAPGGTSPIPIPPDVRAPAAPGGLVVTAEVTLDDRNAWVGQLNASWTHSGLASDGTDMPPRVYEVWGKATSDPNYRILSTTALKAVSITPLPALAQDGSKLIYNVYAVAVSDAGRRSQPSSVVNVTMEKDTTPPVQASAPAPIAVRGVFTVFYDGKDKNGAPMVRDFSHAVVQWKKTAVPLVWEDKGRIGGAGSLTVGDLPYGPQAFRLVAYDFAGNAAVPSAEATATSKPLVDEQEFRTKLDQINADIGSTVNGLTAVSQTAEKGVTDAAAAKAAADKAASDATSLSDKARVDAIAAAATQADAAAEQARAAAVLTASNDATAKANAAKADAAVAQLAAEQAARDALNAAGLADTKGVTWVQSTAPVVDSRYSWVGAVNASESVCTMPDGTVRRNLANSPWGNGAGWFTSSGYGSQPDNSTQRRPGIGTRLYVHSSSNRYKPYGRGAGSLTTGSGGVSLATGTPRVTPGKAYAAGMWMKSDTFTNQGRLVLRWQADDATSIGAYGGSYTTDIPANTWVWLAVVGTAPAGATNVQIEHVFDMVTDGLGIVGERTWGSDVLIEERNTLPRPEDYFDGGLGDPRISGLWIDTSAGLNTPKKWDGSQWYAVTDKAAVDAANAAAAADQKAASAASAAATADGKAVAAKNAADAAKAAADVADGKAVAAKNAADTAKAAADAAKAAADKAQADATKGLADAQTAANAAEAARLLAVRAQSTSDGKATVSTSAPTTADLAGKLANSMWTRIVGGKVVGSWYKATDTATSWTSLPLDPVMIPILNVGSQTVGELDGVRISGNSVRANQLYVGGYQNLVPNGDGSAGICPFPGMTLDTTVVAPGVSAAASFRAASTAVFTSQHTEMWPIDRTMHHFMRVWSYADGPNSQYNIQFRFYDRNKSYLNILYPVAKRVMTEVWSADEYTLRPEQIPSNTVYMTIRLDPNLSTGSAKANQYFSAVTMRELDAGELTVDGSIKAGKIDVNNFFADNGVVGKLTAQMAVFLTNEDGSGTKSVITGQGMKVTYTDPATGEVFERISLGTFGDSEYFGLTNDAGELTISVDKDGGMAGRDLFAENSFTYRGNELQTVLDAIPRGLSAWASRAFSSPYWANAMQPYLHLRFTAEEGRSYMIQTSPIWLDGDSTSTDPRAHLHYEVSGGNASTSSPVIAEGMSSPSSFPSRRSAVTINRLITPPARDVSLLISYSALGGRSKISANSFRPVILTATDIGPAVPETGENRDGSGDAATGTAVEPARTDPTPPPIRRTLTYEAAATARRSYTGSGGTYAFNTGKGYQGLSPAGYGNLKSIWTFPGVTTLLSGATVNEIWAYFYFEHWYSVSGGKARIRMHGNSSLPATYNGSTAGMDSASWPRAAGRWVKVPTSLYDGWKAGTYRGFALEGDGTYGTYGIANACRLRIKYTK